MARPVTLRVVLTAGQRADLQRRLKHQALSPRLRRRLECIRLADQGWPVSQIAAQLGLNQATIRRTIRRMAHDGLDSRDLDAVETPSRGLQLLDSRRGGQVPVPVPDAAPAVRRPLR